MAKIKHKAFNVEMQMKAIEVLNNSLAIPANQNTPISNFIFNINIENRVDEIKKLVFVIVHVEIKNDGQTLVLGTISTSCIFEIANFEDVIKVQGDGSVDMPQLLIETLNSISLSTTRGVMFSTFKGTFLHGAVLPIIDPKQFQVDDQKAGK